MKRIVLFLLVVVTCLAFVSCGESEPEVVDAPKTPVEELSEDEKVLFDALTVLTKDFFDPKQAELLELGSYGFESNLDEWDGKTLGDGGYHTIKVRMKGENKIGGTVNNYFVVRLDTSSTWIVESPKDKCYELAKEGWDKCPDGEFPRSKFYSVEEYQEFYYSYQKSDYCTEEYAKNNVGKYIYLEDEKSVGISAEDKFNIAKINNALKYYWEQKLGK